MLQIEKAGISYGNELLFSGFNLHLRSGTIACISGPSGCGKTSLLNAILGFIPLCQGRILLNETVLDKMTIDLIRRQIAWIPQELSLPMEWVKEMVQLPFELKANRSTPFKEKQLFACFEELELEKNLYFKRVNEVSGGQRQRMMIAVASMLGKPLIVVDEPTSALDSSSTSRVLGFLRQHTIKGGSVLAVTHDNTFAAGCDQQARMDIRLTGASNPNKDI